MKVFSALLGEIKGVFGKAYLLAGLLPATLLVLVIAWSESGLSLLAATRALAENGLQEQASGLVAALILAAVLGLAFFSARAPLLHFFQTLPGLGPVRTWLVRQQMKQRLRLVEELQLHSHEFTVVMWAKAGAPNDFCPPVFVPPGLPLSYRAKDEPAALAAATKAREKVASLLGPKARRLVGAWTPELPNGSQAETIVRGLACFYAHLVSLHAEGMRPDPPPPGQSWPAEVQAAITRWRNPRLREARDEAPPRPPWPLAVEQEIKAWRELREDEPEVAGILDALSATLHGEVVDCRTRLEQIPQLDWIRPTSLGQRAAALEGYGQGRYGIDTSSLLVRLYGVLKEEEQTSLADSRLEIEVLLNLSVAAVITAAGILLLNTRHVDWSNVRSWPPDLRSWLFVLVPAALGRVFYDGAVFAYEGLREKVVRAVDTSRLSVLRKLGFKPPVDVAEERALWSALSRFFVDGVPLDPRYELKVE